MNFGFNSNVRAGKTLYHVQTEDRGPSHPYLDTVVYEAGRVIYKRSTSYEDFAKTAKAGNLSEQLHERLARQHHAVIAELEAGTLPLHALPKTPPPATTAEAEDGLDVCLKNPKNWFASGRATLEIELRHRNTGEGVAGADVEAFLERAKARRPCQRTRSDEAGHVTLNFPVPANPGNGTALVIRATDGLLYGELRFLLKAKPRDPALAPASK